MAEADLGNFFIEIHPDGAFMVATTLEALNAGSTISWRIWIEKNKFLPMSVNYAAGKLDCVLPG